MQKTLGGQRLGSGKKMTVHLKNYERSTHDLGYLWRSSMSSGTLVPFLSLVALPGDTFDIDLTAVVLTHPTVGPLFGSFKVQLDVFQAPIRLYQSGLHNNLLNIGLDMEAVQLPQMELIAYATDFGISDINEAQINPSALLAYLGIRGIGYIASGSEPRLFNAIPLLTYWDIYKNYYANKQETNGYFISQPTETPQTITSVFIGAEAIPQYPAETDTTWGPSDTMVITYAGTAPTLNQIVFKTAERGDLTADQIADWVTVGTTWTSEAGSIIGNITILNWNYSNFTENIQVTPFTLTNIDDMRQAILAFPYIDQYIINSLDEDPYNTILTNGEAQSSQNGLGLKTYQSDIFNNWLLTTSITTINNATAISTAGGSFTLDTLLLSRKVYDLLNRIAVSGGTYEDWIDAAYAHEKYSRCETPMYMGGLSKELVFQQVISMAQTNTQPLGTLGGRGNMSGKHKGGQIRIKVDEPSYIIGIVSLTPRIDYSQGNNWDVNLLTMNDLHKPGLDEIGFQELITEWMAWWATWWNTAGGGGAGAWEQDSAGLQPAWINYMTNYNRTYGNFAVATNEMFMTLNRRYEPGTLGSTASILDLTTYIDPTKYNYIFAQTSLDAQNFWTQIAVDITARRKMSAKVMPNL